MIVVLAGVAAPTFGARIEYVARSGGARVAGAEVCFFRAGDPLDLPSLFLLSDDVRCVSADDVIDVPAGRWGYFLRYADGLVSMYPRYTKIEAHAEERGYQEVYCEMQSAATVDVARLRQKLQPDEWLALFVSHDGRESPPAAVPIPRGESRITVPSALPLIILAIRGGQVTNATHPMRLERRESRAIDAFPDSGDLSTVVAWLALPAEARKEAGYWSRIDAPHVTLVHDRETIHPELPVRNGYGSDGALLVFRGVAKGKWSLRIDGGLWRRDLVPVEVKEAVTRAPRAALTAPASALRIRWTAALPVSQPGSCSTPAKGDAAASFSVRLLACAGLLPRADLTTVSLSRCNALADAPQVDANAHVATFGGLAAATYIAEVKEGGLPARRAVVTTAIGETTTADLAVETFDFHGRVTLGGAPLRARLEFITGLAVSDESGHYQAHLNAEPGTAPVKVIRCEDNATLATHVFDRPIERNAPHDIELPANELTIHVIDATTRSPIEAATIDCAAMMEKNSEAANFLFQVQPTDDKGHSVVPNVPTAYEVAVCAGKAGYEQACSDRFSLAGAREKTITLALTARSRQGIVHAQVPVRGGAIFFVLAGSVTEAASVSEDGSFRFMRDHRAPEYAVVIGASLPLFTVSLADQPSQMLELRVPANARTLSVVIAESRRQRDALIGLIVDGQYIPNKVLFEHQARRGDPALVLNGGPMKLADVAGQSVAVILGPSPRDIRDADPDQVFLRPERRATTVTKLAGSSGLVEFE